MEPLPAGSLVALVALGIWHGANPGMGWLFAVALGMQEERGSAVVRALGPLALGHAAAIVAAIVAAALLGRVVDPVVLKWGVGVVLVLFGMDRLVRSRHPRWVGMRVNSRELAFWSFLMASAHGAGLMVVPFLLDGGAGGAADGGGHHAHGAVGLLGSTGSAVLPAGAEPALHATFLHTLGYLGVTAVLALAVYRWFGLRLLRAAWVNLDRVWGAALVLTGLLTPLL
jgi:hypothetical protein